MKEKKQQNNTKEKLKPIHVDAEVHTAAKILAAQKGMKFKDLIKHLVEEKINENNA